MKREAIALNRNQQDFVFVYEMKRETWAETDQKKVEVIKEHPDYILVQDKMDLIPATLHCSCGYKGDGFWDRSLRMEHGYRPMYRCPSCLNQEFIVLEEFEKQTTILSLKIVDNRKRKENPRPSLSLSVKVRYRFHNKNHKLCTYHKHFRLTHNLINGFTYLVSLGEKRFVRNVTHGTLGEESEKCLEVFTRFNQQQKRTVTRFFNACMKERGIVYRNLKDLTNGACFEFSRYETVLTYLRYPKLQNFPVTVPHVPRRIRKHLSGCNDSSKGIFAAFLHHRSKEARKILSYMELIHLSQFGVMVSNPDHFQKIKKTLEADPFGFRRPLFESTDIRVIRILKWLKSRYPTESQFVHHVVESIKRHGYQGFQHYVKDAYTMQQELHDSLAGVIVPKTYSIKKFHDELAALLQKISIVNKEIPYKNSEVQRFEKNVQGCQFRVAPNTHALVDAGIELNICVGSYHRKAVMKNTTIVFGYRDDKLTYCLEVSPGDEFNRLVQAKKYENERPQKEEIAIIERWCMESGVNFQDCYDLSV